MIVLFIYVDYLVWFGLAAKERFLCLYLKWKDFGVSGFDLELWCLEKFERLERMMSRGLVMLKEV